MSELSGEWKKVLEPEFKKPYYKDLYNFVRQEYATHIIYPPADKLFEALHLTPLSEIKVVILGQDPYHGENQAHGLSFSVPPSQRRIPPSLVNIYKELEDEIGTYTQQRKPCKVVKAGCTYVKYNTYSQSSFTVFTSG